MKAVENIRSGCSILPSVLGQAAGSFKFFSLSSECPVIYFLIPCECFYLDTFFERLLRVGLGLHSHFH